MKPCDILLGFKGDIWVFHIITEMGRTAFSAVTDLVPVEAYGYDSGIMTISVSMSQGIVIADAIEELRDVEFTPVSYRYEKVLDEAREMKGLERKVVEIPTLETLFKKLLGF